MKAFSDHFVFDPLFGMQFRHDAFFTDYEKGSAKRIDRFIGNMKKRTRILKASTNKK